MLEYILEFPEQLAGKTPDEIARMIGELPVGWQTETLRKGSKKGQGWVLREYNLEGQPTGRMIRWHPGGGRHGPQPYWRVNTFNGKSDIIC
ncbi:hypothetical protein [Gloeobacter violaceus]|uniref:Gsl1434 protein n=1 Tax=Gloeobacter violaceus (strain ATCC 29082 / PCC 7421) TaxID=251221 RepID=Q7NKP3_GLOVI|nr:hypothetical protein [Gloeobacter violaceus]BAC89375.1 gsl1434 [Gloeobacter violaceus PCC 7421]